MVVTRMERIGDAFVAESASVTGDVTLGPGANVWFGAVLRGDDAPISVGEKTNVQDLSMVHADPGIPNVIGAFNVIGHQAVLHGAKVGDRCLIGMNCVLLTGSVIGDECIIGAGAVVTEGMVVPPRSVVLGVPGKIVRQVTDEEVRVFVESSEQYARRAAEYAEGKFSR
jgi:carbonic anhydrase/acetyltransferase-like protein (isoleucine patch superfamily)